MGRFYRTTDMRYIDFMFDLPKEMMYNLVMSTDKNIDNTIAQIEQLKISHAGEIADRKDKNAVSGQTAGGALYLPIDEEAAKKRLGEFDTQIDNLTKRIQEHPLEYKKMSADISKLRTDIRTDMLYGELATYAKQYQTLQGWRMKQKEAGVKSDQIARMEHAMLSKWENKDNGTKGTSYNRETGQYDNIGQYLEDIVQGDVAKSAQDYAKAMKNKTQPEVEAQTKYLLQTDDKVNAFLDQQLRYGMINDSITLIDKQGRPVIKKFKPETVKEMVLADEAYRASLMYNTAPKPKSSGKGGGTSEKDQPYYESAEFKDRIFPETAVNKIGMKDDKGNITFAGLTAGIAKQKVEMNKYWTDDQIAKVNGNNPLELLANKIDYNIAFATMTNLVSNTKQGQPTQDEINQAAMPRGVNTNSTWFHPSLKKSEATTIQKNVQMQIEDLSQWNDAPISSSIPSLTAALNQTNLRSYNELVAKKFIKNDGKSNIATFIKTIKEDYGDDNSVFEEGEDYVKFSTDSKKGKSNYYTDYKDDKLTLYKDGVVEKEFAITTEKGKSNLVINYDTVIPVMSPTSSNQLAWRVGVTYNNEPGAIFIPMSKEPNKGVYNQTIANIFTPNVLTTNLIINKIYNNEIPKGSRIDIEKSDNFEMYIVKTGDDTFELWQKGGGQGGDKPLAISDNGDDIDFRREIEKYIDFKNPSGK